MEEERKEEKVGKVTGYFSKISVAAIEITDGEIRIGDLIHIKGHTTDFLQKVESMQIEREPVEVAKPGDKIGIKVEQKVRDGDSVYKVA